MKNYSAFFIRIVQHLLGWGIFSQVHLDFWYAYHEANSGSLIEFSTVLTLTIVLFYINLYWLIPAFFYKERRSLYICLIVFYLFICLITGSIINELYTSVAPFVLDYDYMMSSILIALGASSSLAFHHHLLEEVRLKEKAQQKQLEAELNFFKTQIEPHFLFNTLNTIYSLTIKEGATQSTKAILKLSQITRYVFHDASSKKVALNLEVEFIKNYIELQRLRIHKDIQINLSIQLGTNKNLEIAPIMLISFIENAFKYGVSTKSKTPINISLMLTNNKLVFQSSNHIYTKNKKSSKFGLANVQTRLDLIYPNQHKLSIEEKGNIFHVNLELEL